MTPFAEFLIWWVASWVWVISALSVAADRGWLDPIADSRAIRFIDKLIGPIWQSLYRSTGAEALDRRISRRLDQRNALGFIDLADRAESAGLHGAAGQLRDAARRLTTGD